MSNKGHRAWQALLYSCHAISTVLPNTTMHGAAVVVMSCHAWPHVMLNADFVVL
jgi:hypothetical protein